jgi:hypothetical protein
MTVIVRRTAREPAAVAATPAKRSSDLGGSALRASVFDDRHVGEHNLFDTALQQQPY